MTPMVSGSQSHLISIGYPIHCSSLPGLSRFTRMKRGQPVPSTSPVASQPSVCDFLIWAQVGFEFPKLCFQGTAV